MTRVALVTGAAGFIGGHLVESLRADGIAVRALVRPGEDCAALSACGAEIRHGDLLDATSLEAALAGVGQVYHLAAISRHDARVPDARYRAVNVEGTRLLLEAARRAGARRFVFTGTIEAVGTSRDGHPLTEDSPQHPRNIYGRSKLEAERLVREAAADGTLETVVVRPPMTYGEREPILLGRLFRVIEKGVYPLIGPREVLTEFCYVGNQVAGLRLAAEHGRPGEVYFISDARSYSLEEIVHAIAAELGVRVWTPRLPIPLARAIGLGFEGLGKVLPFYPFLIPQTGRPPFSRKTVEWTAESRLYVDIGKARAELGYRPPHSLAAGIARTVAWYRDQGLLRPPHD
ncbi:NAD-dependent epimerase/dehydratase family protein [Marichromatium gracile]|uniref:UDP-glucose 4-epimerase n=1 Tax=Marichromatium gracile TaxID=1048 RepID=A0A4R4AG43_MARGR|nr:NAD-dependent epimerase/dehydratase family protein [Marichromatium gracile]MBK1710069.1 hypothetical protein [Marichromatium gracile]TCW38171.1 UDP-glucose 4-epimerase [Marichromatium gracile]